MLVFVGEMMICFFVCDVMMLGWIVGVGPLFLAMDETHGGHRFSVRREE